MKQVYKKSIVVGAMALLVLAGCLLLLKPSPVRLTASGHLQNGKMYQAACEMVPSSSLPLGSKRHYRMRSMDLIMEGKARKVPMNALQEIIVFNPGLPLQVSEEGPVVVLSMHAGENEHPVQWRFLNGFFAQRRILNGREIAIHNAAATLEAPTMVSNIAPDSPRRLGASSLLSAPGGTSRKPSQNCRE